ncbi:MAG TPA: hypothetical protein ENI61_03040 [Ignavibacteria bacterium]|nr:hypothetical protein [Ignavibacteria bacterium]
MNSKNYDTWTDELDWQRLNKEGIAALKRKYIKGKEYIELYTTYPEKAHVVAKGIAAFLFSNSYFGGLQLVPLTFNETRNNIDISRYYQQYFLIRRKFMLQKEKAEPDSVHKNLEKVFLQNHIKQEKKYLKTLNHYFESIENKEEREIRRKYVLSYLKWIKKKKNPLKAINYIELSLWTILCLFIVFLILLEFFWVNSDWNFVQKINQEYTQRDSLFQQILIYLIIAFLGSFGIGFLRIKQILKIHRI